MCQNKQLLVHVVYASDQSYTDGQQFILSSIEYIILIFVPLPLLPHTHITHLVAVPSGPLFSLLAYLLLAISRVDMLHKQLMFLQDSDRAV